MKIGQVTLEKDKRMSKQIGAAIKEQYRLKKEEEANALLEQEGRLMKGASLSTTSLYIKNKNRVKTMQETLAYDDKATKIALKSILAEVVEKSLLVDIDEYTAKRPALREHIESTILEFLENADIDLSFQEPHMAKIMEAVREAIPSAKTGMYLEEDGLEQVIRDGLKFDIGAATKDLSFDVRAKVAELFAKEQGETQEIQSDIEDLVSLGDTAREKTKLIREQLVRDIPAKGIIETLAINEAKTLLEQGEAYDRDLSIANALTYVTILESLKVTGLLKTDIYKALKNLI